jgi:hypothetical protein
MLVASTIWSGSLFLVNQPVFITKNKCYKRLNNLLLLSQGLQETRSDMILWMVLLFRK